MKADVDYIVKNNPRYSIILCCSRPTKKNYVNKEENKRI